MRRPSVAASALVLALAYACDSTYAGSEAPAPDAGDAAPASDAPSDDGGLPTDAADAGPACDPTKPFGAPIEVPGLATADHEGSARLSPDELTAYFHASRDGGVTDLYVATRGSRTAAFTGEARLDVLSSDVQETHPTISADGLLLVFSRFSANEFTIHYAQRMNSAAPFGAPQLAPNQIDELGSELQPYLTPGALYYAGYPPDAGERPKIRRASLSSAAFGAKTSLPELDSSNSDCNPTVTPDELTIYFCSDRPAAGAKGQFDIYVARRASPGDAFSGIKPVEELNTSANEYPNWVSPDGCRLYFTSDRVRGDGSGDVFVAERGR